MRYYLYKPFKEAAMKTQMMHTRIDQDIKQKAGAIFSSIGINNADAIRMFFAQVILKQGMPFDIKIPNKETKKAIKESRSSKNLFPISLDGFNKINGT